jgi:NAD(P)-dependent dehydrogenase (short-subunit alcohol dehydrogenase family)
MALHANGLGPARSSRMVIAGGCGGIGRELVAQAAASGTEVIVLDLPQSIRDDTKVEGARYVGFDAADPAAIEAAVADVARQWDRVDSFVFLCGYPILPRRPLAEVSLNQWNHLMAVNMTSAYLLANALLPMLRKSEQAAIVTVASSLAYQVMPGMGAYASSKGGLVSLTKALAMECAPRVRANVVAPGAVETDFLAGGTGKAESEADRSWFDAMAEKYVATVPLGRVAMPADVVGPILFLAGPASGYMTGQVLHLNGGRLTP